MPLYIFFIHDKTTDKNGEGGKLIEVTIQETELISTRCFEGISQYFVRNYKKTEDRNESAFLKRLQHPGPSEYVYHDSV